MRSPGLFERWHIARTRAGCYSNVITGIELQGRLDGIDTFRRAVAQVVLQHPALYHVWVDDSWQRLSSIDLMQVVEPGPLIVDDASLAKALEGQHARRFDIATGLWRLVICPRGDSVFALFVCAINALCFADISLSWHHSCIDGQSGLAFFASLLSALNSPSPGHINLTRAPTGSDPLPPNVEAAVDVRPPLFFLLGKILGELILPHWASTQLGLVRDGFIGLKDSRAKAYEDARAVTDSLDSGTVDALLRIGRRFKVSLTCLVSASIEAAIVEHFSGRVQRSVPITAATGVSLRSLAELDDSVMISMGLADTHWRPKLSVEPYPVKLDVDKVIEEAQALQKSLKRPNMRLQTGQHIGLLAYVSSLDDFFAEKLAKDNISIETGFELSNPGAFKIGHDVEGQRWRIGGDGLQSQGVGPFNQFYGVNMLGVRGRVRLVANFLPSQLDDEDAHALLDRTIAWLHRIAAL